MVTVDPQALDRQKFRTYRDHVVDGCVFVEDDMATFREVVERIFAFCVEMRIEFLHRDFERVHRRLRIKVLVLNKLVELELMRTFREERKIKFFPVLIIHKTNDQAIGHSRSDVRSIHKMAAPNGSQKAKPTLCFFFFRSEMKSEEKKKN